MNKYKVEIIQKNTLVVDVLAKNESEARIKAHEKFSELIENGMAHYHENKDAEVEIDTVYDVTNTDDSFNPD